MRSKGKNGLTFLLGVLLLSALLTNPVWGAASDLRYRAMLKQSMSAGSYQLLELPDEVIAQAQPNLADLRLYSQEEEIPYAVISGQERAAVPRYERVALLNRGTDAWGNTVCEIAVPPDKWVQQLNFISPDRDFIRRVAIEGSRDQRDWLMLTGDSVIFDVTDVTKDQQARHTQVRLTPTNFAYLRITVFQGGKGAFALQAMELAYASSISPPRARNDRPHTSSLANKPGGLQEYTIDLGQANLPVNELSIDTQLVNFNRTIEIFASENNKDWQSITKSELYVYQLDQLTAKQLGFDLKTQLRYLKLTIHNHDNAPLPIDAIHVWGTNPALLFPADPSKELFLYWSSLQLAAPVYDLQKFIANINHNKAPIAILGAIEENPIFQFEDNRPWTERNAWLLTVMLLIVATVLLAVIIRSLRKISSSDKR